MASRAQFTIQDGIIHWYRGPEWDDVAYDSFRSSANGIEEYAKSNAPWADRTGNARAGLTANAQHNGGEVSISLEHTVDYGFWLEVIQNGDFAIIMPTLEALAPATIDQATRTVAAARRGRNF
jgi:hypothetical protein